MDKERPRKKATERQISYANSISDSLGLGIKFTTDNSFYEVGKFLKDYEEKYKESSVKCASIRQIDYANAISDTCGIPVHFNKNSLYEDVSNFISEHKDEYSQAIWRKSILEYENVETSANIPQETVLFICDNLYKKHGLYSFIGKSGKILYIGKSIDLSQRILSSYNERRNHAKIEKIMYYVENNMADVNILEILLIAECDPVLNTESKTEDVPVKFHSGIDILRDFKEIPYFFGCNETEAAL